MDWVADRVQFRLSTGEHDRGAVDPIEVGSGLQSLLEFGLVRSSLADAPGTQFVAVEEPEAFLHPSAQRTLARRPVPRTDAHRLISTHSAVLVDEAPFESVSLSGTIVL